MAHKPGSMVKQTVIVPKSEAKGLTQAEHIAAHFGKIGTHRETGDSYRFRQLSPSKFKQDSFRTIKIGKPGAKVTEVVGKLK